MSLQARASQWDHRQYNVGRDVAHNFGDVMREVADRLEKGSWPALNRMLENTLVTQHDLGLACEAFCVFVMSSADHKKERMTECLARSGWDSVPEEAQVALMAVLGTVMSGYYWVGVREATLGGSGPCLTSQDLRDRGRACAQAMAVSPVRRYLRRVGARLGEVWSTLRGTKVAPGSGVRNATPGPTTPAQERKVQDD